jgi:hypothetical protein
MATAIAMAMAMWGEAHPDEKTKKRRLKIFTHLRCLKISSINFSLKEITEFGKKCAGIELFRF